MKLSVLRQVHLTHSTRAKLRADFVATEFCTAVNRHFRNITTSSATLLGNLLRDLLLHCKCGRFLGNHYETLPNIHAGVFCGQLTGHETFLTVDGLRRWSNPQVYSWRCIGILSEIASVSNPE